jgi:hypothetical protein
VKVALNQLGGLTGRCCRHGQNIAASASGLGVLVKHGRQSQPSSKLKSNAIRAGVGRKERKQEARKHAVITAMRALPLIETANSQLLGFVSVFEMILPAARRPSLLVAGL